jgi:hypothetical protein
VPIENHAAQFALTRSEPLLPLRDTAIKAGHSDFMTLLNAEYMQKLALEIGPCFTTRSFLSIAIVHFFFNVVSVDFPARPSTGVVASIPGVVPRTLQQMIKQLP